MHITVVCMKAKKCLLNIITTASLIFSDGSSNNDYEPYVGLAIRDQLQLNRIRELSVNGVYLVLNEANRVGAQSLVVN